MQIRTRLTIQFTVLVSVILFVGFGSIYFFRKFYLAQQFDERLEQKALTAAELLVGVEEVNKDILLLIDQANRDLLSRENILIYNARNTVLYQSNDSIQIALQPFQLDRIRKNRLVKYDIEEFRVVGVLYKNRFDEVIAVAGAVNLADQKSMRALLNIMVWAYLLSMFFVGLLGWLFAERALRPIAKVIDEVGGMYPKNLHHRLVIKNEKDEIGRLSQTFNALLDRVEQAFRSQEMFVSNVSHELKNPLTKITSQIEVILLKDRDALQYQKILKSVLVDVQEMTHLTKILLELAKVSGQDKSYMKTQIQIDEVLWEARELLRAANPSFNVDIVYPSDFDDENLLQVPGNPYLLKVAFINLMENGCKFSENQRVKVEIFLKDSQIELRFINKASIKQSDLSHIFEPFYRAEKTANIRGYGIGLSQVASICKFHGANISVETSEQNVIFKITDFQQENR